MLKQTYQVLGVMSGTSLDGIDLAHLSLSVNKGHWQYDILEAQTVPYTEQWRVKLKEAIEFDSDQLANLNKDYTLLLANIIKAFIIQNNIANLDAVCSHGHTVLHQPYKGLTLQIGNLPEIASLTHQRVVCDFRVADVALGGQGAPLVPIGDRLLFGSYDYCINLGGFANVSYETKQGRLAYDLCPVNVVLNPLAERLGAAYDKGGAFAREGVLIPSLLEDLNQLEYYKKLPPKSLGVEWVANQVTPLLQSRTEPPQDLLHTLVAHMAAQIAAPIKEGSKVLFTGGGAYNQYLIEQISNYKKANYTVPDSKLVEYKEALIFGLLGVLKLRDQPNCLASVTGAKKDHCSGNIFKP